MLAEELGLLGQLVTAATGWHNQAATLNVSINQMNITMPDGGVVVMYWDTAKNEWNLGIGV